jgi:hypothetical protein
MWSAVIRNFKQFLSVDALHRSIDYHALFVYTEYVYMESAGLRFAALNSGTIYMNVEREYTEFWK